MGRPIIGITGELDAARWGDWLREAAILPVSYIRAVERAGGARSSVPPVPPAFGWRPSPRWSTAWCSPGAGTSIPALYDQERHEESDEPDQRRDRFELALMRAALDGGRARSSPIGRGLHILTLARGGTLTQHLPGHRAYRARYAPHDVVLSGRQPARPAARHPGQGARRAPPGPLPAWATG